MKIAFFVNHIAAEISEYGTTRLAMAAGKRGHEVWYVSVGAVDYGPDDQVRAAGHRAEYHDGDELKPFLERAQLKDRRADIILSDFDAVWLRNEAVDDLRERPWAALAGTAFGRLLAQSGVTVVNNPDTLARAGSKLYLHEFPQSVRPRGVVSRHPDTIKAFIQEVGRAVVKPVYGAKGRNVFMVDDAADPNLNQIIEAVCEDGYATAQEFVEGGDCGDIRMFLLDGELMEHDGMHAAFARVPGGDDPRANISAGGKPKPIEIGAQERRIVSLLRDKLVADGLFFVGIDVVGDRVVEINAESPGGLQSAEYFTKYDFGLTVCEALERRVERARAQQRAA
jgi:glutathione synthase